MATTGTVLAKYMKISTGATPVAISCQIDATLEMSTETFDTTCKDSGADAENRPGTKSWSMSGTGNFAYDAANGYDALHTAWSAQSQIDVVIGTGVSGDKKWSGKAYVTGLTLNSSGNDAAVTYDFTLTGTGALTYGT